MSADEASTIRVWRSSTGVDYFPSFQGSHMTNYPTHKCVAFNSDNSQILYSHYGGYDLYDLNLVSGATLVRQHSSIDSGGLVCGFSRDDSALYFGYNSMIFFDVATGSKISQAVPQTAHQARISGTVSANFQVAIIGTETGEIQYFRISTGELLRSHPTTFTAWVTNIHLNKAGTQVAFGKGNDATIQNIPTFLDIVGPPSLQAETGDLLKLQFITTLSDVSGTEVQLRGARGECFEYYPSKSGEITTQVFSSSHSFAVEMRTPGDGIACENEQKCFWGDVSKYVIILCAAGYVYHPTLEVCQQCGLNMYAAAAGSPACLPCFGQVNSARDACDPCPIGTAYSSSSFGCLQCSPGYYSSTSNSPCLFCLG